MASSSEESEHEVGRLLPAGAKGAGTSKDGKGKGKNGKGKKESNETTVFITGLSSDVNEEVFRHDFAEIGEIERLNLVMNDEGKPTGIAFVTYKSKDSCDRAIEFNETDYGGRTMYVRMASEGGKDCPSATVLSLAGNVLATITPTPHDVRALKLAISEEIDCSPGLMRLIKQGSAHIFADGDVLPLDKDLAVTMVVDETNMCQWDWEGNPNKAELQVNGSTVKCPDLRRDFINVIAKEPMTRGVHYFEFAMHFIGDEQWCGVIQDPAQAGSRHSGRGLKAWTYYCGRMGSQNSSIVDGLAALHAEGRAVKRFDRPRERGDVIGMLVDLDKRAVAFDLNGKLQGACAIPGGPLWVLTHVDTPSDHVELRKPNLQDAPPQNFEALSGALLEVSGGAPLSAWGWQDDASSSSESVGDYQDDEDLCPEAMSVVSSDSYSDM